MIASRIAQAVLVFNLVMFLQVSYAQQETFEDIGDRYYNMRNILKGARPQEEYIENAISNYRKALENSPSDERIIFKYFKANDFYCMYFVEKKDKKKLIYRDLIKTVEKNYSGNAKSPYLNYCLAVAWGRYGELLNILDAAKSGVAGKIKKYAENLYAADKNFNNCVAGLILGRLYYQAPRIPVILTWPDVKKSKKYLEECVASCPASLQGKYYLADTLYELKETEEAQKYYNEVISAACREEFLLEDREIQKGCTERMKALGIK